MLADMTSAASAHAPTNREVADVLGISEASVSRYRGGERHPKFEVQLLIAEKYDWPVSDQAVAHSKGEWGAGFEQVLCRSLGSVS